ncbi:MAG: cytochrome ubiquinol oxidase subunit I [Deltaproteobacteria bacterium]|nr:cytochrome ubiquinol oxidase subunit I [Deltaproteobacteria bacterium]
MFHITWAATSVGLSTLLVVMEGLWLKTGDVAYYHHTRFWGRLFLLGRVPPPCRPPRRPR